MPTVGAMHAIMDRALALQTQMTTRATTHIAGNCENILTHGNWHASGMLLTNATLAQLAAVEYREFLTKSRPSSLTKFQAHVRNNAALMGDLSVMANANPPELLWHHNLKRSRLSIFLACRFLGQPDGVIDCESVHGRWKWIMDFKTGTKHKLINAILKISARMLHYGSLPPDDRLHRHILDVRANMNSDLKLMDPNVARGTRTDWLFRERLNLSHNDIDLLRSELGKSTKHKNSSWSQDRSIYMRSLLKPLRLYFIFRCRSSDVVFGIGKPHIRWKTCTVAR